MKAPKNLVLMGYLLINPAWAAIPQHWSGELVSLQWTGPDELTARVHMIDTNPCYVNGSRGTCLPLEYGYNVEDSWSAVKTVGTGLKECRGGTSKECWDNNTVVIRGLKNVDMTEVYAKAHTADGSDRLIISRTPIPVRPGACATEITPVTLPPMRPGDEQITTRTDNIRVLCHSATDLRITVLTPSITYTIGAMSTITAPTTMHVGAQASTGVPITISTRVDPSDVMAGTYSSSVIIALEHD